MGKNAPAEMCGGLVIYTSYFAMVNRHPLVSSGSVRPLSIARRSPPGWPIGESASYLWPEYNLLMGYKEGLISPEEYERQYRAVTLSRLVPEEVVLSLEGRVMVCYEKPSDFCHRHIVARGRSISALLKILERR